MSGTDAAHPDERPMPDWFTVDLRVPSADPRPLDEAGIRRRLGLTVLALAEALLGIPALVLAILTLLSIPLAPLGVGLLVAHGVVPATAALVRLHRRLAGEVLGERIHASYAVGSGALRGPVTWFRDKARWRDFGYLAFSATGGFAICLLPAGLLTQPVVSLFGLVFDFSLVWVALLVLLGSPSLVVWWLVTPALLRARAIADRGILSARTEELERRVEEVTATRAETLDHTAAEIRRIERDLHDGPQARLTAIGMTVGYAETLMGSDPDEARRLMREARDSTVAALEDLRSLVRGIHPPVLADLGLVAAVENLALQLPLPVTLHADLDGHPPAPVESAAYFAIAECLANTLKHAAARQARVALTHDGHALYLECGDDGRGGATTRSSGGLAGLARRLSAFDGTMTVTSPEGGPTSITMEIPCALSSQRTSPSSGTG